MVLNIVLFDDKDYTRFFFSDVRKMRGVRKTDKNRILEVNSRRAHIILSIFDDRLSVFSLVSCVHSASDNFNARVPTWSRLWSRKSIIALSVASLYFYSVLHTPGRER